MMKSQIGLGVLSIPAVFDVFGLIPGVVCLILIAVITTWSDYIVGVFKLNHPEVYGIDDVGYKLFGRVGREVFGVVFVLCRTHSKRNNFLAKSLRSLDLCCWRGYAWCFYWAERSLHAWYLHCRVCRCGCRTWFWVVQHSDTGQG